MSATYVLDGKKAINEPDLLVWGKWFKTGNRHVKQDNIGDVRVSTVFLGINHSYGIGPPMLFETMAFGGSLDGEQEHCSTWEEAEAMHAAMVERVKNQGATQ